MPFSRPYATQLEAAVRQRRAPTARVGIDRDGARLDAPRSSSVPAGQVGRPDAGRQAVVDVVGEGDLPHPRSRTAASPGPVRRSPPRRSPCPFSTSAKTVGGIQKPLLVLRAAGRRRTTIRAPSSLAILDVASPCSRASLGERVRAHEDRPVAWSPTRAAVLDLPRPFDDLVVDLSLRPSTREPWGAALPGAADTPGERRRCRRPR